MYTIEDVVELGHLKFTGGSIKIKFYFEQIVDPTIYLEIMDYLDHSIIHDNVDIKEWSERYLILDNCENLFHDIFSIISYFIEETKETEKINCIEISLNKETFYSNPTQFSKLIDYNIKG